MQPTDSNKHDPHLHQTIARNMTDAELASRIDSEGDQVLPEYKSEAIRRFAGITTLPPDPDLAEAMQEPAIREACEEMCAELEHGRDYL